MENHYIYITELVSKEGGTCGLKVRVLCFFSLSFSELKERLSLLL